jgi:hypothetical protein
LIKAKKGNTSLPTDMIGHMKKIKNQIWAYSSFVFTNHIFQDLLTHEGGKDFINGAIRVVLLSLAPCGLNSPLSYRHHHPKIR